MNRPSPKIKLKIKHTKNNARNASLSTCYPRFMIWLQHHKMLLKQSLKELRRNPFSVTVTLLVLAIAIALPLGFHIILNNITRTAPLQPLTPRLAIYLNNSSNANDAQQLISKIKKWPEVEKIKYISPAQGLQQLSQRLKINNLLAENTRNPLPAVITIQPKKNYQNPQAMKKLQFQLNALPGIANVQLNNSWMKRLYYLMQTGRHLAIALMILFAVGIVFIITHTLRHSLIENKNEIAVMQLIGAPARIIRGRLIYRGIWLGVFSSLIASIIIIIFFSMLQPSVTELANSYQQSFNLQVLSLALLLKILISCAALGGISAWAAYIWHQHNQKKAAYY
jgi:cell division transport system permease protein